MKKPAAPSAAPVLIGVDPGTRHVGWGVIKPEGTLLKLISCGVISPPAKAPLEKRLELIFSELEKVLARYKPEVAALEETFAGVNMQAAIAMGEGRGVALLALTRSGASILPLAPNEIKKAVTGRGHADKGFVARMVCARLGLTETPEPEDVTDALAAAIALAHRRPWVATPVSLVKLLR